MTRSRAFVLALLLIGLANTCIVLGPLFWWRNGISQILFTLLLSALSITAGLWTPDGRLWFTPICLSVPWLFLMRSRLSISFVLICYLCYFAFVRFGMMFRRAARAFHDAYSGHSTALESKAADARAGNVE